jgi:hypothetical protein
MNDLERDLRELLQRKADEGWAQPEAPVRMLRRVRRRQATTAVMAGVAAALVGLASFAGVRAVLDPDGGDQPAAPTTTRTLNGITIEYPEGWFLVDPRTLVGVEGSKELLLSLANHEPTAEALGCPGLDEGARTNRVMLTVQGYPSEVAVDSWPASLDRIEIEEEFDRVCYPGWELLSARWTASGRSYEGVVGMGPDATEADRAAISSAFASMSFAAAATIDPGRGTILAGGSAGGELWRLSVRREGGGFSLELDWEGGASGFGYPPGTIPDLEVTSRILGSGATAEQVVFGVVTPEAEEVSIGVSPDGEAIPATEARIVDIPDDISADVDAFVGVTPIGDGSVRAFDAEGNLLAEVPTGPPPPEEAPTETPPPPEETEPPVAPVAPVQGGRYWAVYLGWSDDPDSPELVEPDTWLEDVGIGSPGIREAGCDHRSEDVVHGARYMVAVYFETERDAEAFWTWYVAQRGLEGPFNVPIIDVTTSCSA